MSTLGGTTSKGALVLQAFLFSVVSLFGQQTIEEIKLLPLGTVVTTTGTITSGQELGQIRYLQDYTAGIAAYAAILAIAQPGDSIMISGVLSKYRANFNYILLHLFSLSKAMQKFNC